MSLVYAPNGLVGVLTPQANTTVEPELHLMCPPGVAMLTARMTSHPPHPKARPLEYYQHLPRWTSEFSNPPLAPVATARTRHCRGRPNRRRRGR